MRPGWIVAVGWLIFVVFAYPGYLTTESLDQLMDARVGSDTDWYAPTMSAIWRLVGHVISGPFGMLALQSGLFLAGAAALLRRALSERAAALAASGVLLFPPVAAVLAVIWRDGQLAGFLLAGAAALASPRRGVRLAGSGLLVLGVTMRDGATMAALPLVLGLFAWPGLAGWRRLTVAAAVWAAVATLAVVVDRAQVDQVTDRPALALARLDIVGIARFAPLNEAALAAAGLAGRVPAEFDRHVRVLYRYPARYDELLALPAAADLAGRAALLQARRRLIAAHPGAYLRHRGHQLWLGLGVGTPGPTWRPVYASFTETPEQRLVANHRATHSAAQRLLVAAVRATPGLLFRPYLYAALAVLLLPLAVMRRHREALALLASGLGYQASLLVTATVPEYRLAHWMIACTVLAAVMLAAGEFSSRADRRARSRSAG